MTEFPQLSVHCYLEECKQVDFLPFVCDGCGQQFCLDHRTYESHHCPNPQSDFKAVFCPICNESITIVQGQDPNQALSLHIDEGCKPNKAKKLMEDSRARNTCSMPRCKKFELSPVVCKACKQTFCLRHRLEMDHDCPGKPVPKKVSKPKPKQKTKKAASATRAQLEEYRRQKAEEHAARPARPQQEQACASSSQQTNQQQHKREDAGCTGGESCIIL